MGIGAIVVSLVTTAVDSHFGSEWFENVRGLYANKPAGDRAVLSTVAGIDDHGCGCHVFNDDSVDLVHGIASQPEIA